MNVLKKVFHLLLITCAAAMAQGFASIMQQAPVLFAAATTRNPYLAYSMLPIFSAQEAGRSYVEARNEGLSYQDAYNNAKINYPKHLQNNTQKIKMY